MNHRNILTARTHPLTPNTMWYEACKSGVNDWDEVFREKLTEAIEITRMF